MVQTILSSMDSEEINSINDTVESDQITKILKSVYEDLIGKIDFPEHYTTFELTSSGDVNKPVLMTKPTIVDTILWIKYDRQTTTDPRVSYQEVVYKSQPLFFQDMYLLNPDASNVDTFNYVDVAGDTIPFYYTNDTGPKFFTVLRDGTLFFDSIDLAVDTTLQKNKTVCYGKLDTSWSDTDSFVPNLDAQHFPLLLQEAKALAHYELRQIQHQKAEVSARQQKIALQRNKTGIPAYIAGTANLPDYGRKR